MTLKSFDLSLRILAIYIQRSSCINHGTDAHDLRQTRTFPRSVYALVRIIREYFDSGLYKGVPRNVCRDTAVLRKRDFLLRILLTRNLPLVPGDSQSPAEIRRNQPNTNVLRLPMLIAASMVRFRGRGGISSFSKISLDANELLIFSTDEKEAKFHSKLFCRIIFTESAFRQKKNICRTYLQPSKKQYCT